MAALGVRRPRLTPDQTDSASGAPLAPTPRPPYTVLGIPDVFKALIPFRPPHHRTKVLWRLSRLGGQGWGLGAAGGRPRAEGEGGGLGRG